MGVVKGDSACEIPATSLASAASAH